MTTAVGTLTEFLLARIAEDEAVARAAKPGPWHWERRDDPRQPDVRLVSSAPKPDPQQVDWLSNDRTAAAAYYEQWERWAVAEGNAADEWGATIEIADTDAAHIARHDPARVLAECDAKRRIVADHASTHECPKDGDSCGWWDGEPCDVIRLLALPYADHPDYRDEWRP